MATFSIRIYLEKKRASELALSTFLLTNIYASESATAAAQMITPNAILLTKSAKL